MKRGYFGIGIYHTKTEVNIGTLWRSAFLMGADFIYTIGRRYKKQSSDTVCAFKHIPLYDYLTIEDFKNNIPRDCQIVCVELTPTAIPLQKFSHPERAIYMLGAEDHGIPKSITQNHKTIIIETEKSFSMNVATAGSIIMYDRLIKRGSYELVT